MHFPLQTRIHTLLYVLWSRRTFFALGHGTCSPRVLLPFSFILHLLPLLSLSLHPPRPPSITPSCLHCPSRSPATVTLDLPAFDFSASSSLLPSSLRWHRLPQASIVLWKAFKWFVSGLQKRTIPTFPLKSKNSFHPVKLVSSECLAVVSPVVVTYICKPVVVIRLHFYEWAHSQFSNGPHEICDFKACCYYVSLESPPAQFLLCSLLFFPSSGFSILCIGIFSPPPLCPPSLSSLPSLPPFFKVLQLPGGKCCSYTFNFHCAGIPEICNISTLCAYEPEIEGRTPHTFSICVLKHDYTHSCLIYCPSIIKTWSSSCSWCVSYVKHLGICRCCSQYVIVSCIKPQISGWRRKSGKDVLNLFGLKKNIVHQGRLSLGEPQLNLNGEPWPWII